jgi:hypothetical protein
MICDWLVYFRSTLAICLIFEIICVSTNLSLHLSPLISGLKRSCSRSPPHSPCHKQLSGL